MNDLERIFFDEYKHLDKMCREIFGSEQGVTEYINQMEYVPYVDRINVICWDADYKMLKHVRWIRNTIAHDERDSGCSEQDVQWVRTFYQRILDRNDSYSQYYSKVPVPQINKDKSTLSSEKMKNSENGLKVIETEKSNLVNNINDDDEEMTKGAIIGIIVIIIFVIVIVIGLLLIVNPI